MPTIIDETTKELNPDQSSNNIGVIQYTSNFQARYKKSNFITKHWVGYYSLPIAYWLISLICNGFISVSNVLYSVYVKSITSFNPYYIFFASALYCFLILSISIWHIVGTWNSATQYSENPEKKGRAWGRVAKFFLLFGILQIVQTSIETLPILKAYYQISFSGDPEMPDYKIVVTESGTELKIMGGLKFGLIDDVQKILIASPDIKTVNLESMGGRLGVAEDLHEIIQSYSLNTVSNDYCLSACTIAFAAGKNRWLGATAQLGFHAGALKGFSNPEFTKNSGLVFMRIFQGIGTSDSFIKKVNDTPNSSMWYPDRDELLKEHFITTRRSQAVSSERLAEQKLREAFKNKDMTGESSEDVKGVDLKIMGYRVTYFYEMSNSLSSTYRTNTDLADKLKNNLRKSLCEDKSTYFDISEGIIYSFVYRSEIDKRNIIYFDIDYC